MPFPRQLASLKGWLGSILCCCAAWPAFGQSARRPVLEPQWFRGRLTEIGVGYLAEGTYEETTYSGSDNKVSHLHFFTGPTSRVGMDGSIYHPNLVRFTFNSEFAYGYSLESTRSAGQVREYETDDIRGHLDLLLGFLMSKPYNGEFFVNWDRGRRENDVFSTVEVESLRYGGRAGYRVDNLNFNATYTHREEDVTGLNTDSRSFNETFVASARHDRKNGATSLNLTWDEYSRDDRGRVGKGTDQNISLANYERLGSRQQYAVNANASYDHRDDQTDVSDQATVNLNIAGEHNHGITTMHDLNYDHFETGSFKSDSYNGNGEIRHQLYESLNSALLYRGGNSESSDDISDGYSRRYGGGFSETYTKRLGVNSRVRFSNTLLVDHIDQQAVSSVKNERHQFDDGSGPPGTFALNVTRVATFTIVVTDQNDSQPAYILGLDYEIVQNGDRTLISRPAASTIPVGATVLVDYRAEPAAAGNYESLSESFQIRFDLFTNVWGIYGRFNLWRNNAGRDLRVPNLTSYAVGTDVSWRNCRAGAEYEVYDSDFSSYGAARFFQSAYFQPDKASTLSLELTEAWIDYTDANRQEWDLRFVTRFSQTVSAGLRLTTEAGVDVRRGDDVDQTLAAFRQGLEYTIGRTSFRAGYDFEYNLFDREERLRHLFFLRCRRTF